MTIVGAVAALFAGGIAVASAAEDTTTGADTGTTTSVAMTTAPNTTSTETNPDKCGGPTDEYGIPLNVIDETLPCFPILDDGATTTSPPPRSDEKPTRHKPAAKPDDPDTTPSSTKPRPAEPEQECAGPVFEGVCYPNGVQGNGSVEHEALFPLAERAHACHFSRGSSR